MAASNAKYYSGISDPQPTLDSLRSVAQSLKNNLEVLTQQKDPLAAAAVTFQDLLDVGLLASISPVGIMKGVILESLTLRPVPFADLPTTPVHGMLAAIMDSTTAIWGATIAGGGANKVLGHYNGTVWTVAAV